MALRKTCRHATGLTGRDRVKAWRACNCSWYADIRVDGRRRYLRLGTDERQAVIRHAQLVADNTAGRALAHAGATVDEVSRAWIDALVRAGRKPRTIEAYEGYARLIRAAFTGPVSAIGSQEILRFRRGHLDAGRAPQYVDLIVGALMGMLRYAVTEGVLDRCPDDPRPPRPTRHAANRHRLSLHDCGRLIEAMRPPWRDAAELVLLTGLRIGELLALTPEVCDIPGMALQVKATRGRGGLVGTPKTASSDRTVTLTPRAVEIIAARCALARPGEHLWAGTIDGACRDAFRDARRAIGITDDQGRGLGWHALRHAHTALLDAAGVSLRASAQQLGHGAHTAMTMGYGWRAEAPDLAGVDAARARLTRHGATPPGEGQPSGATP